jgi:hypothetical protein
VEEPKPFNEELLKHREKPRPSTAYDDVFEPVRKIN